MHTGGGGMFVSEGSARALIVKSLQDCEYAHLVCNAHRYMNMCTCVFVCVRLCRCVFVRARVHVSARVRVCAPVCVCACVTTSMCGYSTCFFAEVIQ